MNAIRLAVEARGIPYLVHFTRTKNLPSIFEHGIVPRNEIGDGAIEGHTNDELRLDNQLGANCLSIAFPNAKMLWKLRAENPGVNWAVLVISRTILWELPCAFCPTNAASAAVTCQPIQAFQTAAALEAMCAPDPLIDREAQHLMGYDPTDVQAEVLAFGRISPDKIMGGAFQRMPSREQHKHLFGAKKTTVHGDRGFFSQRWYHRGGQG
jgi:hypothetical protein